VGLSLWSIIIFLDVSYYDCHLGVTPYFETRPCCHDQPLAPEWSGDPVVQNKGLRKARGLVHWSILQQGNHIFKSLQVIGVPAHKTCCFFLSKHHFLASSFNGLSQVQWISGKMYRNPTIPRPPGRGETAPSGNSCAVDVRFTHRKMTCATGEIC